MKTIEIQLYKFNELSSEAQQNAIDKWRESDEYVNGYENEQSLKAFLETFPIQVKDWSYDAYSHNERILYSGEADHQLLSGKRLVSFLMNNYYSVLFEKKVFKLKSGKTRKSRIIEQETCCPFTGFHTDEALLQPIREFLKTPSKTDFEDLLADCIFQWGKACESDCYYQQTTECITETILANDYDFTANGEIY